jgi:hypothetical protein
LKNENSCARQQSSILWKLMWTFAEPFITLGKPRLLQACVRRNIRSFLRWFGSAQLACGSEFPAHELDMGIIPTFQRD